MSIDPSNYVLPTYNTTAFNCPYCDAYAHQEWFELSRRQLGKSVASGVVSSLCAKCNNHAYWYLEEMIYPRTSTAPMPHTELPDRIKANYLEAREIVSASPRGACAILRLALQELCIELGEKGKNINEDIGELVKKGLPVEVQQALDALRRDRKQRRPSRGDRSGRQARDRDGALRSDEFHRGAANRPAKETSGAIRRASRGSSEGDRGARRRLSQRFYTEVCSQRAALDVKNDRHRPWLAVERPTTYGGRTTGRRQRTPFGLELSYACDRLCPSESSRWTGSRRGDERT